MTSTGELEDDEILLEDSKDGYVYTGSNGTLRRQLTATQISDTHVELKVYWDLGYLPGRPKNGWEEGSDRIVLPKGMLSFFIDLNL